MTDKIRLATKKDVNRILELYNSSKNLWYGNSRKDKYNLKEIIEYISNKKNKMFVFERNKKVMGAIFAEFYSDYVYLHTIIVDYKFRGQGIGHLLMNSLLIEAKKQKKTAIEAITEEHDIAMQKIFRELNYRQCKKFIAYERFL